MADLIPSVSGPNTAAPAPETAPQAVISPLPANLPPLRPGDSLLLQTLQMVSGRENASAPLVTLNINGQNYSLPLQPDPALENLLDPARPQQLEARVISNRADHITLRVTSVEPRPQRPSAAPEAGLTPPLIRAEKPAGMPELLPLPLKTAVENLLPAADMPLPLQKQLINSLPDLSLRPQIISVNPPPSEDAAVPLTPISVLIADLKSLTTLPPAREETLVQDILRVFRQPLPARVVAEGEVKYLQTELGKFWPKEPLKWPAGTTAALDLLASPPLAPPRPQTDWPQMIRSLSRLLENLPDDSRRLPQLLRAQLSAEQPQPQWQPLLKLLTPLRDQPQLASMLMEKIPAAGPKMLAGLHDFYRAAAAGDPEVWLGEKLTGALRESGAAGTETINRAADFLHSHVREAVGWKLVEMPFFDGSSLAKIKLALRSRDEETEDPAAANKQGGVRFLLETVFSRLGAFQLDGFALKADRRFDLIVRTAQEQPEDLVAAMVSLFKISLNDLDYNGIIRVNQRESFFRIPEFSDHQLQNGLYI